LRKSSPSPQNPANLAEDGQGRCPPKEANGCGPCGYLGRFPYCEMQGGKACRWRRRTVNIHIDGWKARRCHTTPERLGQPRNLKHTLSSSVPETRHQIRSRAAFCSCKNTPNGKSNQGTPPRPTLRGLERHRDGSQTKNPKKTPAAKGKNRPPDYCYFPEPISSRRVGRRGLGSKLVRARRLLEEPSGRTPGSGF